MRVLVVEDDPGMASVLSRGLVEDGFAVDVAGTATDGSWYVAEHVYDVIVLDVMLPDGTGFDLLAHARAGGCWAPVLFLTARDAVVDRIRGLDLGADDYLTKPFAFPELLARLRALMRRGARERPAVLRVGDLRLDPARRSAYRGTGELTLTAKEFAVLECFMRHPGDVLTRSDLIAHVWDDSFDLDSNVVDVYVANLRAKIGARSIETVRGVGYRLRDDGSAA